MKYSVTIDRGDFFEDNSRGKSMAPRNKGIIASFVFFAVITLLVISGRSVSGAPKNVIMEIAGKSYNLLTAGTSSERAKGLSGIRELSNADGMIFYFNPPRRTTFWNKDTHIDLVLIWFSNGNIISRDFLPSEDKAGLVSINSPSEVDSVVELVH